MRFLVTGGAGFIGSAFVRMLMADGESQVVNLDKLTYAGNLENLAAIAPFCTGSAPRYRFVHGDICDGALVRATVEEAKPDVIVHFAAESHVDRSILSPEPVFETNLRGTLTMLEAARQLKIAAVPARFHRRGVRKHRASARGRRELSAAGQQPVFGLEGGFGSAGAVVFHHLQNAGDGDERI